MLLEGHTSAVEADLRKVYNMSLGQFLDEHPRTQIHYIEQLLMDRGSLTVASIGDYDHIWSMTDELTAQSVEDFRAANTPKGKKPTRVPRPFKSSNGPEELTEDEIALVEANLTPMTL